MYKITHPDDGSTTVLRNINFHSKFYAAKGETKFQRIYWSYSFKNNKTLSYETEASVCHVTENWVHGPLDAWLPFSSQNTEFCEDSSVSISEWKMADTVVISCSDEQNIAIMKKKPN